MDQQKYDSRPDTVEHIRQVRLLMSAVIDNMKQRRIVHDASKLEPPEKEGFDEFTPRLRALTYGSPEYEESRTGLGAALTHHYAHNSHHPEHSYVTEEWRPVVGYEGLYKVSTFGRVQNCNRNTMMSLQPTPKGYQRVSLCKQGDAKNHMVHRLVALAFLDNIEKKPEVNHLDGVKDNNNVRNLEWSTESENQLHAYDTGLKEPSVKYFVHCVELDIVTRGIAKMAAALKERGIARVSEAGIWTAMDREGKHLDLTFVGYPIADGNPQSMVRGMSLLDLVEMMCDWRAATMRHADGDIRKSVEINQQQFGYSDELKGIFINTLKELKLWPT